MLPDIPKIKRRLNKVQWDFFHRSVREQLGPFKDCKSIPIYEGDAMGIERPTGDREVKDLWRITTEATLEPQNESLESSFLKIQDMAAQAAGQFQPKALESLTETLDEHGQTIDAKGKNIVEAIFEAIEKIELPLGEDGKLDRSGMQIVCGKELFEKMKTVGETPEMHERLEKIMKEKEAKAHAREANRKLVG